MELYKKFIAQNESSIKSYQHILSLIEQDFTTNSIKNVSLAMLEYFEKENIKWKEALENLNKKNEAL